MRRFLAVGLMAVGQVWLLRGTPTGAVDFTVDVPRDSSGLVVSAADFGVSAAAADNVLALNRALAFCQSNHAARLVVPTGIYRMTAETAVALRNFKDFVFDGGGSTFVFLRREGVNFILEKNERLVVRNLKVDWDWEKDPLASLVEVLEATQDHVDFKFVHYDKFPRRDVRAAYVSAWDEKSHAVGVPGLSALGRGFDMSWTGPSVVLPKRWLSGNVLRIKKGASDMPVGSRWRMQHYYYDLGGFVMDSNRHLLVEDVDVLSNVGHAFYVSGDQRYTHFRRVKINRPKDDPKRLITCTADHFHVNRSNGWLKLEDCDFSLGADDGINIHDCTAWAPEVVAANEVWVANGDRALAVGDETEFRNADYSPTGVRAKVTGCRAAGNDRTGVILTFDSAVPSKVNKDGFVLFNRSYCSDNVILRNTTFRDNRARGVIIQANDVTVEGCTFRHTEGPAMKITTGWTEDLWCEGVGVTNCVVRNCRFEGCNAGRVKPGEIIISTYLHQPSYAEGTRKSEYPIIRDVLFENNVFVDSEGPPEDIASATGVVFHDNRIETRRATVSNGRSEGLVIRSGVDWIPMTVSRDVVKGSALDFSRIVGLDAPAGKYGFVRANGPHFVFEKLPGVAQRFCGANLCLEANYPPTEEAADRLIARLTRNGYNAIRIHHHDKRLYRLDNQMRPVLNESEAALLDRFVAKAIAAGLYVTTDLYVSRPVCWKEIGVDRDGSSGLNYKLMLFVHDGAFENWKMAAKALMTHRNPYTGRTYAEEPAIMCLCLVNENSIQQSIRSAAKNPYLLEKWREWFTARRAESPACWPTLTKDEIPVKGGGWSIAPILEGEAWDAVSRFCADLEASMYTKMRDYLRNELGVRALLSDQNWGTQTATFQSVRAELYDYVDAHLYVDHPSFPGTYWQLPSTLKNENILKKEGCDFDISWRRVADRPFAVSEWQFCGPGRHRSMSGLYMGTLAALQDWGALWRFSYSHGNTAYTDAEGRVGYFDTVGDPVAALSERLFVPLFLRGDLASLTSSVATVLTPEAVRPSARNRSYNVLPAWFRDQWDFRVATACPRNVPEGTVTVPVEKAARGIIPDGVRSPSPAVSRDVKRGVMSVATSRTCALYATEGSFSAGVLSVENQGGEATVWATSLDEKPIERSCRLLVVRLGDIQSEGTMFADATCRKVLNWGSGYCMERGRSLISLRHDRPCAVWSLDISGRRRSRVAASWQDGRISFVADVAANPNEASFAYELVELP